MDLNKKAKEVHVANVEKGFYDKHTETGTKLMLVVTELAEAMEADRVNNHANLHQFNTLMVKDYEFQYAFKSTIKDTFEDEIADSVIRLLDLAGFLGMDLDKHVRLKLQYNQTRPVRHGKDY